jgi:ribonucleoside-diphosphate reductase alpha chain
MRVAMGLALNEIDREARAIEFYEVLSTFDFMSSTPTLFNAGTRRSQLSSCYLTTVSDDLDGIYEALKENALLSKFAGGLGNDWTNVRALGSHIKGTNGKSQGVVPFLKVVNDTAVAVNQGGKRKGAVCAYLESWHLDIEEFLELRKNTGDDRARTHDMNTANWVPDLFMKRVMEGGDWTLFSPSTCPDLHDKFGKAFEEATPPTRQGRARRDQALQDDEGERPLAQDALDAVRDRASLDHVQGRLQRALAAAARRRRPLEQPVHRDHAEHRRHRDRGLQPRLGEPGPPPDGGQLDQAKLKKTVATAMRMLDNVIDINYYAVKKARDSNLRHRPVGSGSWASRTRCTSSACRTRRGGGRLCRSLDGGRLLSRLLGSTELAAERGRYSSYHGSLWDRGSCRSTRSTCWPSSAAATSSSTAAHARLGCAAPAHRPARHAQFELRRHRADGDDLQHRRRQRVDRAVVRQPVGQVQPVGRVHDRQRVPGARPEEAGPVGRRDGHGPEALRRLAAPHRPRAEDLKALYATAFEIETQWLVEAAARRQKWIDQAQSLNIYMAGRRGRSSTKPTSSHGCAV